MSRISDVGPQGQHAEESAQNIFTLGYPCNRLHMKGMQAKENGNKGALPLRTGHDGKDHKQQYGVRDMKEHVYQMVRARIQPKKLAVHHER